MYHFLSQSKGFFHHGEKLKGVRTTIRVGRFFKEAIETASFIRVFRQMREIPFYPRKFTNKFDACAVTVPDSIYGCVKKCGQLKFIEICKLSVYQIPINITLVGQTSLSFPSTCLHTKLQIQYICLNIRKKK